MKFRSASFNGEVFNVTCPYCSTILEVTEEELDSINTQYGGAYPCEHSECRYTITFPDAKERTRLKAGHVIENEKPPQIELVETVENQGQPAKEITCPNCNKKHSKKDKDCPFCRFNRKEAQKKKVKTSPPEIDYPLSPSPSEEDSDVADSSPPPWVGDNSVWYGFVYIMLFLGSVGTFICQIIYLIISINGFFNGDGHAFAHLLVMLYYLEAAIILGWMYFMVSEEFQLRIPDSLEWMEIEWFSNFRLMLGGMGIYLNLFASIICIFIFAIYTVISLLISFESAFWPFIYLISSIGALASFGWMKLLIDYKLDLENLGDAAVEEALIEATGKKADKRLGEDLRKVEYLSFRKKRIEDLSPLDQCTELSQLILDKNPEFKNFAQLKRIPSLTNLSLRSCRLDNISFLHGLERISNLHMSHNQITDLTPLEGLSNLERLSLNDNQITDLGPLSGLERLAELDLGENKITSLGPLSGLIKLKVLKLRDNFITDLTPLRSLTELEHLFLELNPTLCKSEIENLHKALPKCNIEGFWPSKDDNSEHNNILWRD